MFATFRMEGKPLVAGLVIHDTDPGWGSYPHREEIPDCVRLRRDLEKFYRYSSLPLATFIGASIDGRPPLVLTGGLGKRGKQFCFKTTVGVWDVDISPYAKENDELFSRSLVVGIPSTALVMMGKSMEDASVEEVTLKPWKEIRSELPGIEVGLSWIGGLALRHARTTTCLFQFLAISHSCGEMDSILLPPDRHPENRKGSEFWSWFPSAKPRSLRTWLKFLWSETFSLTDCHDLYSLHPVTAGFYKMKLIQRNGNLEVVYCESPVYTNEVAEKSSSSLHTQIGLSNLELCCDLCVCSPTDVRKGISNWGFKGMTKRCDLFILGPWVTRPQGYGPVRSDPSPSVLSKWRKDCKASKNIPVGLLRRVKEQCREAERAMVFIAEGLPEDHHRRKKRRRNN